MDRITNLLAALLVFFGTGVNPCTADQADPRLDRLFQQLLQARLEPEIVSLKAQVNSIWAQSGSDSVNLLMHRAQEAARGQQLEAARRLLDVVIEVAPRFAQAHFERGMIYAAQGDDDEALADFRECLRLEGRHFDALTLIGQYYERQKNFPEALIVYRRLLQLIPLEEGLRGRIEILREIPAPI
ncbi:MAG TPA: hypothetical protein DCL54_15000 [Alphaproteobacteria bacterium]|nr:hypothetical protein [Alphaproteobacteria bacterium]